MYSPSDLQIRSSKIDGLGIFAVRAIPSEMLLLEYVGKLLTTEEFATLRDQTYCFAVDQDHVVDGAQVEWNPAGFFNHSCEANCRIRRIDGKIWIVTQRDVKAGEELTYNYGYRPKNLRRYPCRCGASRCVGYIVAEDLFPLVKQLREAENQKSSAAQ